MAFPTMRFKISPTPIERMPRHLSRAISQLAKRDLMLSNGTIEFYNSLHKQATVTLRYPLTDPNRSRTFFQWVVLRGQTAFFWESINTGLDYWNDGIVEW